MKKKRTVQASSSAGLETDWDHAGRQAQDKQSVMGVGRAGAPLRNSEGRELSRNAQTRIRETKTSRLRISRPGKG